MQKHVNLVDLVKSFPTNIFLQNLASIQKRTSPIKFAHLAEKSENGSISNLSTEVQRRGSPVLLRGGRQRADAESGLKQLPILLSALPPNQRRGFAKFNRSCLLVDVHLLNGVSHKATGFKFSIVGKKTQGTCGHMRRLKAASSHSEQTATVGNKVGQNGEAFCLSP